MSLVRVQAKNISGHGIDNHMSALRQISMDGSRTGEACDLFNDPQFVELFRFPLTTSQVPTGVAGTFLCYGPVVDDGYGCAYNPNADSILFAVSAFRSAGKSDARVFKENLRNALREMRVFLMSIA